MFEQIKTFVTESINEVRYKVSWPTYAELSASTVIVLVGALVISLLVGLVDVVFENGMTWFYRSF